MMTDPFGCSLVTDVIGGERRGPLVSLNAAQRRFLTLYLSGDPDRLRLRWMGQGGEVLGDGPVWIPAGAVSLHAYRLTDGGLAPRGNRERQRNIGIADLLPMAGIWERPLLSLNARGVLLAQEATEPSVVQSFRMPGRRNPVNYRQTPVTFDELKSEADRQGRPMTAIINDALAQYLELTHD